MDEFFAKKDKSKKVKTKTKFITMDLITKKLEDNISQSEDSNKKELEKSSSQITNDQIFAFIDESNRDSEDDEWDCAADQKAKDYSGLRIQALSITEKNAEEELAKERMVTYLENMEEDTPMGPWKILPLITLDTNSDIDLQPKLFEAKTEAKRTNTPYRPPAVRRRLSSKLSFSPRSLTVKKEPELDISCEKQFPSLASAIDSNNKTLPTKIDKNSPFSQSNHTLNSDVSLNLKKFSSLRLEDYI